MVSNPCIKWETKVNLEVFKCSFPFCISVDIRKWCRCSKKKTWFKFIVKKWIDDTNS